MKIMAGSILVIVAIVFMPSCTFESPIPQAGDSCSYDATLIQGVPGSPGNLIQRPGRPAGMSELAVLMRDMLDELKLRRERLDQGITADPLPDFSKLRCAWPTDLNTRTQTFDKLASVTLDAIQVFNSTHSRSDYDTLVGSCLACHQTMCPGPMAAIRPLLLEQSGIEPFSELGGEVGSCEGPEH